MGFDDAVLHAYRRGDARRGASTGRARAWQGITLESLRETGWARLNLPSARTSTPRTPRATSPRRRARREFRSLARGAAATSSSRCSARAPTTTSPAQPSTRCRTTSRRARRRRAPYPLNLLSPKAHAYINSTYGNQPTASCGCMQRAAEAISPATTPRSAGSPRATGPVRNERGRAARARAGCAEDVAPGVVVSPMGSWLGWREGGATVNAVTAHRFADLGRAPTFSDTAGRGRAGGLTELLPQEPRDGRGDRRVSRTPAPRGRHPR